MAITEEEMAEVNRRAHIAAASGRKKGVAEKAAPTPPPLSIVVNIPDGMEQYTDDIRRFIDAMMYKLERNRNKGRWENTSLRDAFNLLQGEVNELLDELGGNSVKTLLEAADVANFAMIVASIAIERGK